MHIKNYETQFFVLSKTGIKTFLIVLVTIFWFCNNTSQNNLKKDSMAAINHSINTQKDSIRNSEVNDSVIQIRFPADSISTSVIGKMKGMNHPISVYVDVKQGRQFTASISSEDSTANVRINQLITPDGKADGPFGKELKFAIHQQGTYKLLIGENLMQGDEWKGKFKLTVKIED